jgi:hypothetical protein
MKDFEVIGKLHSRVFLVKKNDETGKYYAMKVLEKSELFQHNLLK